MQSTTVIQRAVLVIVYIMLHNILFGQGVLFYHLNTSNGLTSNHITSASIDKNGILWIGTPEGLNSYDGYTVTQYRKSKYPGMGNNDISSILCDSRNRLWMGSFFGTFYRDEKKQFNLIQNDTTRLFGAMIMETKSYGIIISSNKAHVYFDETKNKWVQIKWSQDSLFKIGWRENVPFKDDQFIHTGSNGDVVVIDFASKTVPIHLTFKDQAVSSCRLNDNEIMVADFLGNLFRVDVHTGKIIKTYEAMVEFNGKKKVARISAIKYIADNLIVIGTQGKGLLIFDAEKETWKHYIHNIVDSRSIAGDNTVPVYADAKGNVLVSTGDGLSYVNIYNYNPEQVNYFQNEKKEIYTGPVLNMIESSVPEIFWLGTKERLIQWNRQTNQSQFFYFQGRPETVNEFPVEITSLGIDDMGRIWAGTSGMGIYILSQQGKEVKHFIYHTGDSIKTNFPTNFIYHIRKEGSTMWVATRFGIHMIDPVTWKVKMLRDSLPFKNLPKGNITITYADRKGNYYFYYPSKGVYKYNKSGAFSFYSREQGMLNYYINDFQEDRVGNIYMLGTKSIDVLGTDGKISVISITNELKDERSETSLSDSLGNLWIANGRYMGKYDPVKKTFTFYDYSYGFPNYGFESASLKTKNGDFMFGGKKGLTYFSPFLLKNKNEKLSVWVHTANFSDTTVTNFEHIIELEYKNSRIDFSYSAIDIYGAENISYSYKLEGADKIWSTATTDRTIRYTSIAPGSYTFLVRASRDGVNWTEATYPVYIKVAPPFWQQSWFIIGGIFVFATGIFGYTKLREKNYKKRVNEKAVIDKRIAEVEMQALRAQMNPHFMFNSLNSINNFILKNDPDNASGYLTKFSRLMRLILDNSRSEWVLLENELKALSLYIELEAVRFDNSFKYDINIDPEISIETVAVPPMIIQPYVENAIWHGLLHRTKPGGKLTLRVWEQLEQLHIEIEDNGVGREEAKRLKSKTATRQKSHGMKITAERMDIVNKVYNVNAGTVITDVADEQGNAMGTRVLVTLQYKIYDGDYS